MGWGLLAPAGPCLWARNHPAAARTKAISWGPPPCSSIRKGGPLYGWKNRGIFAVMGTGRRGLGFAASAASCSHPGPMCPSSMEEVGRLWRDAGVLRGSGDGAGPPWAREGAWDQREHPGKFPSLAPVAPVASPGSCRGAWSRSPGPRFSAGECLLRTPKTTGRGSLHGEGGFELCGTQVVSHTVPSLKVQPRL